MPGTASTHSLSASASLRLVTVPVYWPGLNRTDLAEATRVLRDEYGTDVYVTVAKRPGPRGGTA